MSRTAKQLIYGAAYLVILLLIILAVYGIWFRKAPAPVLCASCATANLEIVTSTMPLQAGQDQSVILATFENGSSDYGVNFSYNVVVDSVILGEQIDAFNGTSSILPNSSRYIVLTGISDNAADIGSINLTTSNITWVTSTKMVQYDLSISGTSTNIGQSGGYVGGTITNNTALNIANVRVSAIIYDKFGNIIGASKTDAGSLPAYGKGPFQVTFPAMDVRTFNSLDKAKTQIFYEVTQN